MPNPIFVHSMFRAGSTYVFAEFRQVEQFMCFQEPVHEIVFGNLDTPENLLMLSGTGREQENLRHPKLAQPYFFESFKHIDQIKNEMKEEIIYETAFGNQSQDSTVKFYKNIISSIKTQQCVFQECRTSYRISALKNALGGVHIFLRRNPVDQWWSQKTTPYFSIANQVTIDPENCPDAIELFKHKTGFVSAPQSGTQDKFRFRELNRLSPENELTLFLLLWCISSLEAKKSADIVVDMDLLSNSPQAKTELSTKLGKLGLASLDFTQCRLPTGFADPQEISLFRDGFKVACKLLTDTGTSQTDITYLREIFESGIGNRQNEEASSLKPQIVKLKELVKTIELDRMTKIAGLKTEAATINSNLSAQLGAKESEFQTEIARLHAHIHGLENLLVKRNGKLEKETNAKAQLFSEKDGLEKELAGVQQALFAKNAEFEQEVVRLNGHIHHIQILLSTANEEAVNTTQLIEQLQSEINSLGRENKTVTRELTKSGALIKSLELTKLKNQTSLKNAETVIAKREAELSKLKKALKFEQDKIEEYFKDYKDLSNRLIETDRTNNLVVLENVQLKKIAKQASEDVNHAQMENARQAAGLMTLKDQNLSHLTQQETLLKHIENLERDRTQILSSTSWKLSAPLRFLLRPRRLSKASFKGLLRRFKPMVGWAYKYSFIRKIILMINKPMHTNLQNKILNESGSNSRHIDLSFDLAPRTSALEFWNDKLQK